MRVAKEVGLRYWEGKKVRGFLVCYHCGKRRCIYSPQDKEYKTAQIALQQKFESVTGRFSCGSLLFDDGHHLSKILVQKQNLTCESPIEKGYYNNKERKLKLKDICVHCGEMGSKEFLLSLPELQERCLTEGYNCHPICVTCLQGGKKVLRVKNATQNQMQKRKERLAKGK